jgi:hypothetical protein
MTSKYVAVTASTKGRSPAVSVSPELITGYGLSRKAFLKVTRRTAAPAVGVVLVPKMVLPPLSVPSLYAP